MFEYVRELDLPGPSDNIQYVCAHISTIVAGKKRMQAYWANVSQGAQSFVSFWRQGRFGKLCLDHIPGQEEMQRLRMLRAQTELPGPSDNIQYVCAHISTIVAGKKRMQ